MIGLVVIGSIDPFVVVVIIDIGQLLIVIVVDWLFIGQLYCYWLCRIVIDCIG